jgi:uncharacterized membrane protein
MLLARALAASSVVWLALLVFAASSRVDLVYAFASFICHQQPDRSFAWSGVPWPVCARCLGLYAAAPAGATLALALRAARRAAAPPANVFLLGVAAIPTLVTWTAERLLAQPMTNGMRFAAALPLGAAVAWVIVRTARETHPRTVSRYTLGDARRGPTE